MSDAGFRGFADGEDKHVCSDSDDHVLNAVYRVRPGFPRPTRRLGRGEPSSISLSICRA